MRRVLRSSHCVLFHLILMRPGETGSIFGPTLPLAKVTQVINGQAKVLPASVCPLAPGTTLHGLMLRTMSALQYMLKKCELVREAAQQQRHLSNSTDADEGTGTGGG